MSGVKLNGLFFDVSNSSTGEVVAQRQTASLSDTVGKKRHPFRKFWFANMSYPLENLMSITKARDFHVLFGVLGLMNDANLVTASNAEIGKAVNMLPNHVGSSLKRLEKIGLIYSDGRAKRVNEGFAWKGALDLYPWKEMAGAERVKTERQKLKDPK